MSMKFYNNHFTIITIYFKNMLTNKGLVVSLSVESTMRSNDALTSKLRTQVTYH